MKVSIFMPAYNAAVHIKEVIERIPLTYKKHSSIYMINDGSKDDTGRILAALSEVYTNIKTITFNENKGYGAAVKAGLNQCKNEGADYAACIHADGQYPPEYLEMMINEMESKRIDLMQGSRIASGTALSGGMPLYKFIAGKILTVLENRVLGLHLTDYHSGFLIYNKNILNNMDFNAFSNSFDIDLQMIVAAQTLQFRIGEYPVPTRYADEISYLNPFTYGLRVLKILAYFLLRKTYKRK